MLFRSSYSDIDVPSQTPAWDWLFARKPEHFSKGSRDLVKGFVNTDTNERLTHLKIKDYSVHLSTALVRDHGLQVGDVVSICSPNSIWYPVGMFGVMRAGGVSSLSSPSYTEDEMVHVLKTVKCKFVMTSVSAFKVVMRAVKRLGVGKDRVFIIDGNIQGFMSLRDLLEVGRKHGDGGQVAPTTLPAGKSNSEVCTILCFSSGTTGLPKAVMISPHNIIAQCLQLLPTTSTDHRTILGLLPFYHITGVIRMLVLSCVINAEVAVLPQFTMKGLLETITKYQIAEVQMVPPIIIRMIRDPLVDQYDLSCIKRFASGAAPISAEVLQLLERKFPGRGFKQGYGMTESVGCITTHPLDKHAFKYARTGGSLVANTLIKVVDLEGKLLGIDEKGEILAKGPQIVIGYFNNPKATAESFDSDGFFRTGDEGSIDGEGLITIHDRIKEMIKVKGIQVAPAELEDLLLGHPKVDDCAVIGIPDDYSGERPFGFVVLIPGTQSTEEVTNELLDYVRAKKVRTKWLHGVRVIDQVPKSASGKILRRVLRDRYKSEVAESKPKL